MTWLCQITAPHLCAGFLLRDGVVVEAAPILRYMVGWDRARVAGYVLRKGWTVAAVAKEP